MRAVTELRVRPICAVCGHPVERFEELEHYGRMRLVATCHGERETVDLEGHETHDLAFGIAFAHGARRLPAGTP